MQTGAIVPLKARFIPFSPTKDSMCATSPRYITLTLQYRLGGSLTQDLYIVAGFLIGRRQLPISMSQFESPLCRLVKWRQG